MTMRQLSKYTNLILTICLIIFFSCNTTKNVERKLNKAYVKSPTAVAKKTREWFPCETKKIVIDTNARREIIRYKDSLGKEIVKVIDTINVTIYDTTKNVVELRSALVMASQFVNRLQSKIDNLQNIKDTIYLTDRAEVIGLTNELKLSNEENKSIRIKVEKGLYWIIGLLIALTISIILNILKYRK